MLLQKTSSSGRVSGCAYIISTSNNDRRGGSINDLRFMIING